MAVKHVKAYFDQICEQYHDMLNEIRDFEEEAKKGLIEPERLDRIKETIKPLMDNYERWSYMMFLLNQPNRKEKKKAYEKRNEKFIRQLKQSNNLDSVVSENTVTINKLSEIRKSE